MKDEPVPENEPKTPFKAEKSSIGSKTSDTWQMIRNLELAADSPRSVVDGGLQKTGLKAPVFLSGG